VGSACLLTDCVFSLVKGNFYQLWQSFNSISIWLCASEVNFSNGTPRVSIIKEKYNQRKHFKKPNKPTKKFLKSCALEGRKRRFSTPQ